MSSHAILYGSPHSFYSAKVRSYLRKQGIAYRERMPSSIEFVEQILPVIGRGIIPVLVTPDGQIIQDSIDIIDYYEAQGVPLPAYPTGAKQQAAALWFEYFSSFCMLRPAMHYRWSVLEQQRHYLTDANVSCSGAQAAEQIMQRMHSYLPGLGVNAHTAPLIEQRFTRLLALLEAHFIEHPYLLGGRPCLADYALIGPMYAHLARDPVPAMLIRTQAPKVFRWIERMQANDPDMPEYPAYPEQLLADDQVPESIEQLLRFMSEEVFPELNDKLAFMDQWVAEHAPTDGQPVTPKAHQRYLGVTPTHYQGISIQTAVAPYLLYLLRRLDRHVNQQAPASQRTLTDWLNTLGLPATIENQRDYSVGRAGHIEVWQRFS